MKQQKGTSEILQQKTWQINSGTARDTYKEVKTLVTLRKIEIQQTLGKQI
jgi:hypothetical protein